MFGLEEEKSKSQGPAFDLEKEVTGPEKAKKVADYRQLINSRLDNLKKALREGEDKEEFKKSEVLLNGYNALQQVIERAAR